MSWLLFVCGGVVLTLVTADTGCTQGAHIPPLVFKALVSELKSEHNSIVRQEKVEQFLKSKADTNGLGFTGEQTAAVLDLFQNSITQSELIQSMGPFQLGLTSAECANIMSKTSSSFTKMDILKALVRHLTDAKRGNQLTTNAQLIIDQFSISFDKDDAKDLILKSTPYSCVFGPLNSVARFAFVIDVSGSMGTTFVYNGKRVSRLSFIQDQLVQSLQGLQDDQEFNLISFSSAAQQWQPGVQPVNAANVAKATAFAQNLRAGGSTCMKCGLGLAFRDPKVLGVYLLTDGAPDSSPAAVYKYSMAWATKSTPPKPIYCIGFQAGSSAGWMQKLSNDTGGIYRSVN